MCANFEGQNPDINMPNLAGIHNGLQLIPHHSRTTDGPVQYCLVDHGLEVRGFLAPEDFLAEPARLDALVDHFWTEPRQRSLMDGARVVGRLKQSGKHARLIVTNLDGRCLEANVRRVGQVERLPPSLIAAFPGERREMVTLRRIPDTVEVT